MPIGEKRTDEFRNDLAPSLKFKIKEEIVLRPYIHDYKDLKICFVRRKYYSR